MAGILEHPQAQELLEAAAISAEEVNACSGRLRRFLTRYLPLFQRQEQRDNALTLLEGKFSGLDRKTAEPIAHQAGVHRKPLQSFVGSSPWDDEAVMAEIRHHVQEQWADPDGVFILDGSAFPKKGTHSCGVARMWCGRLGKVENCQLGVFLAYACRHGHAPLDRQLFLPKDWADDPQRRAETHVPPKVLYQEQWRIALDLLERSKDVPHAWVVADDDFGRASLFRAELRRRGERYIVDVPADTLIRDLEVPPPVQRRRSGSPPLQPWEQVQAWAARQPAARWQRFEVRPGEKGPLVVEALTCRVQTRLEKRVGPAQGERLVVIRTEAAVPVTGYHLSNAGDTVRLVELVKARSARPWVERVFQEGNGEVGLDHYEVRSWVGWHHHMTLSLLALWFLSLERTRVGGEKDGAERVGVARGVHAGAVAPAADGAADRLGDQSRAAA
jgi:SRSO17 transposase